MTKQSSACDGGVVSGLTVEDPMLTVVYSQPFFSRKIDNK